MRSLDTRITAAEKAIGTPGADCCRLFYIAAAGDDPRIHYYGSSAPGDKHYSENIPDLPGTATADEYAAYLAKYCRDTDIIILDDLPEDAQERATGPTGGLIRVK
jgi:hypothetical protein